MQNKKINQKLVGKDFVHIGIYSILIIVVFFVVSLPFFLFKAVTFPFEGGTCALFTAPIFMLMTYKVAKRGTILLSSTVIGLFTAFTTGYVHLIPFGILTGLLCEAVMWKQGSYRSLWHNATCFSIFSALLYTLSTLLPIYLFGTEYYLSLNSASSATVYIQYALSPLLMTTTVAITIIMAIAGCLIGQRMLKKHFIKSGLISSEGPVAA